MQKPLGRVFAGARGSLAPVLSSDARNSALLNNVTIHARVSAHTVSNHYVAHCCVAFTDVDLDPADSPTSLTE